MLIWKQGDFVLQRLHCTVFFCFNLKWNFPSVFLWAVSSVCLSQFVSLASSILKLAPDLTFMFQQINDESASVQLFTLAEHDAALHWTSTVLCWTIQQCAYQHYYSPRLNVTSRHFGYHSDRVTPFNRGIVPALTQSFTFVRMSGSSWRVQYDHIIPWTIRMCPRSVIT